MGIKKKAIAGFILATFVLASSALATNISNADQEVVRVNGERITEQDVADVILFNAGITPALEVLDFKVLQELYANDPRLQEMIDERFQMVLDRLEAQERTIEEEFEAWAVDSKEEFLIKANIILESYRQLARIDTAYEEIFTQQEKDYIYKWRISGTANIYHILIAPEISFLDSLNEELLNDKMAEARQQAESIITELNDGLSFSEAISRYSDNKTNENGLIGNFNVNTAREANLPQVIINEAFQLENQQHSTSPILTPYGFMIIYVEYTEEKPTYEESQKEIARILFDLYQGNNQFTGEYAMILFRDNHRINIDDDFMSVIYANNRLNIRRSFLHFDPTAQQNFGF